MAELLANHFWVYSFMGRMITVISYCLTPFLAPFLAGRLYLKGRRSKAYGLRISERFSLGDRAVMPVDVWLHAVSLGEVVAASPLIEAMLAKRWRVLVTTMTPTGSQHVIERFGSSVVHQYLPYDLPWSLRRFFKKYQPRLGLIMETELWPNLIDQAKKAELPLFLLNARLSDKAFKQYEKVTFIFKPILSQFTAIFAQTDKDAKRFIQLGALVNAVHTLGNMKFDVQIPKTAKKDCVQLKAKWGEERTVFIAASTHDDEESQLLSRLNQLKAIIPHVILLLVPRHPERFAAVYQLSVAYGFKTAYRSVPASIDTDTEVVIVDSLGELLHFYQMSDYAFVGGSLVPVGGHNVLEPIAMQVPVFCGPYMHNSNVICQSLTAAGALHMVNNAEELVGALSAMHQNNKQRQQQIANASAVLEVNRGTVARYMEQIEAILKAKS